MILKIPIFKRFLRLDLCNRRKFIISKEIIDFSKLICRNVKYSRRQWDGLIKAWKLRIHAWNKDGDSDVFETVDEWKPEDPILGVTEKGDSTKTKLEKSTKNEESSFSFNWSDDVEEQEKKEILKRRKVVKKE